MKLVIFGLFLTFNSIIKAQEKQDSLLIKQNKIIYVDFNLNYINGAVKGVSPGLSINYQSKKNLFTFRFIQNYQIERARNFIFVIFPTDLVTNTFSEYSLLYGRRFVKENFSYHFSAGFSYNNFTRDDNGDLTTNRFVGFPIEMGVTWFNNKKEQFKIWDLIPVGKPTGFGRSMGIKLYANIAKKSYVGLGVAFGLGFYKKYN